MNHRQTLLLLYGLVAISDTAVAQAADLEAGRLIYRQTCSTCHGVTGTPNPADPLVEALGVVPADLADPLFVSREPTGDWEMVVRHGGHAMGLSEKMPAHPSLSDEDVTNVVAYVKSIVDTSGFPPGELNLFLPIRTKKAFPEDEIVYVGRFTDQDGDNAYKNVLEIEKRIGKRGQAIFELIHEAQGDVSEVSEIEVGYKHALYSDARQIISGAAVVAIPVEAEGDGELQTYLAYGRELSATWIVQSSLRLKFPLDDAGDGEAELAGIVHYRHSPWPRRVFPGLEAVATGPYRSRNGDLEWTVMPQVRVGLTRGGHVALNLGVEVPLSGQDWDLRYYVTLLWDFADGGFFKGW